MLAYWTGTAGDITLYPQNPNPGRQKHDASVDQVQMMHKAMSQISEQNKLHTIMRKSEYYFHITAAEPIVL